MKKNSFTLLLSSVAIFLSLLVCTTTFAQDKPGVATTNASPRTLEWTDLMPDEDLQLLLNMPQVDHGALSDEELAMDAPVDNNKTWLNKKSSALEDQVTSAIEQAMTKSEPGKRTWQDALTSTRVRPELANTKVRLAGYIVPLEYDDNEVISSFFFVPYFGACIHVPPPPPNQLIHVTHPKGFKLNDLYTPYWLTGTLQIKTVEHEMGLASYAMTLESMVEYTEELPDKSAGE